MTFFMMTNIATTWLKQLISKIIPSKVKDNTPDQVTVPEPIEYIHVEDEYMPEHIEHIEHIPEYTNNMLDHPFLPALGDQCSYTEIISNGKCTETSVGCYRLKPYCVDHLEQVREKELNDSLNQTLEEDDYDREFLKRARYYLANYAE